MSTKIADVIVPEVFNPYVVRRTTEKSELYQSGIIAPVAGLDVLGTKGGDTVTLPFWNDLSGAEEILSDTVPLTPAKITSGTDRAVLHARGKAWGVHDLAKALAGDDPMAAIGDLTASYWARRWQVMLISSLKGVFASEGMADNVADISAGAGDAGLFSSGSFVSAVFKLGDEYGGLTAMAVHSAVLARMITNNLIVYAKDSEGNLTIPTYMGIRLIVDDALTPANNVYTAYLFGAGAIGYGEGNAPVPTETDRDSLLGEDYLINRRHFVLHPRGVRFTSAAVAGVSPTNAELENAANWGRVYDAKQIRIVQFRFRLA
ncbi:MAG: major capsid protein [Gemmatimonadota bacterium]|nr:major capsid protein [Gemmatimonadota bacterium]